MTNKEAKEIIESECYVFNPLNFDSSTKINTALDMAIKTLEQEPCEDAISRAVAINAMTHWFSDMLETGKEKYSIDNVLNGLPSVAPTQKWIPVSERLPENQMKSYWICTDCGYQCECRWTNVNPFWIDLTTDWHWHHMDIPSYQKVVAWMPLPKKYKTEMEREE